MTSNNHYYEVNYDIFLKVFLYRTISSKLSYSITSQCERKCLYISGCIQNYFKVHSIFFLKSTCHKSFSVVHRCGGFRSNKTIAEEGILGKNSMVHTTFICLYHCLEYTTST